jgi:hypothetical protein
MQMEGAELLSTLATADKPIDVRDAGSRFVQTVSPQDALQKARTGCYVGVGSRRRIRYLKKIGRRATLRRTADGSHTTVGPTIARLEHARRCWLRSDEVRTLGESPFPRGLTLSGAADIPWRAALPAE